MRIGDLYRRIRSMIVEHPSNFSWLDRYVAGSGRPVGERALRWLKRQGIEAILSLTEDPLDEGLVKELGIEYKHNPMKDHSPPKVEEIASAVDFIEKMVGQEKPVLVHCAAGLGRTGTVLAAYLVKIQGLTPEEAIARIRELRPGSIEPRQEEAVVRYAESLG